MVKYFAKYDSVEAFEADKANLPANCVILVGSEISIAPSQYTIAVQNNRFSGGGSGDVDPEAPLPINPIIPNPGDDEPWAD